MKYLIAFIFCCGSCSAQSIVTLKSLLTEMTDPGASARWPAIPYTIKQASSYDRRSISPDQPGWFANGDFNQFIRSEERDGHTENVMMDADGPGAVVRFWLTSLVKKGTLRFYFDNESQPSVIIPAYDLMKAGFHLGPALLNPHSSYEPEGKGGNTLYLPLPYQKHCKITWENTDTSTIRTPHYYQINYRTYPAGTTVKTFSLSKLAAARSNIDAAEKLLWHPDALPQSNIPHAPITLHQTISPNGTASIALPDGPSSIRTLSIKLSTGDSASYEKAWRFVILKIEFEGQATVWCPLGDFAGSGYGGKPISSWYRELNTTGTLTTRWVMPYKEKARVSIINQADFPVNIDLTAQVSAWKWDANTLYFHTTYKYEKNVKDAKWDYSPTKLAREDTAAPIEWNFITAHGKGIYMGNTLSVYNNMQTWYGEGDAKVYVDKENFPSEFGTGLEDYYNTSWAPVVLYQTPFANAPRADNVSSFGHNTFTRTRNLDAVPFLSNFKYDLEMLSWNGGTIDIAATTYWYGLLD